MRFHRNERSGKKVGACRLRLLALVLSALILAGCATAPGPQASVSLQAAPGAKAALLPEDKALAAVLPMGVLLQNDRDGEHPAALAAGAHAMLQESVAATGRFRLVDARGRLGGDALARRWKAGSGVLNRAEALDLARSLGADTVFWGEVYDFARGTMESSSGPVRDRVRVGLRVYRGDVASGRVAQATGAGYGAFWQEAVQAAMQKVVDALVGE
ncbi:MAG: hypothetical protein KKA60_01060 [Proteobacteria bacterium]|nr:hypothetical protein [Pseudomonadota bacterium]